MIWNAWNKALGDSKGDYDDFWPSSNGITSRKIGVLADILRVSSRIWCINLAERETNKGKWRDYSSCTATPRQPEANLIFACLYPQASARVLERLWYIIKTSLYHGYSVRVSLSRHSHNLLPTLGSSLVSPRQSSIYVIVTCVMDHDIWSLLSTAPSKPRQKMLM